MHWYNFLSQCIPNEIQTYSQRITKIENTLVFIGNTLIHRSNMTWCVTLSEFLRRSTIRDTKHRFFNTICSYALVGTVSDTNIQAFAKMVNEGTCTR